MEKLDKNYWENRYQENQTGWDIGAVSTPIKEYIDQLKDTSIKVLIPGCGNGYEGEYFHLKGFSNIFQMDLSPLALEQFSNRVSDFPKEHLLNGDFFEHHSKYDLIIEQTFFCAIHPSLRKKYVASMASKLNSGGKLVGLLFNIPLHQYHPPFGGNISEYQVLFSEYFLIKTMEPAYNSIPPRAGNELFIILEKK